MACLCSLALAASSKAAYHTMHYCSYLTAAHTWCDGMYATTHLTLNSVNYTGSGVVSVCERAYTPAGTLVSRRCANNAVDSGSDLSPYYSVSLLAQAANDSDWAHTINGYAHWQD